MKQEIIRELPMLSFKCQHFYSIFFPRFQSCKRFLAMESVTMDEQTKFLLKKDFIITSWQNLQVCVGINQVS